MKRILLSLLSTALYIGGFNPPTFASESKRVNIYIDRNMVCVQRSNKCYAFAKGSKEYPTPTWEGPQYLTTHKKKGFRWQNPITGKIYEKGQHNLGDIWIQFYKDEDPNSKTYGWAFGFHQTPEIQIPLHLQESHGCGRMSSEDIKNFSAELQYLDEFYIVKN